MAETKIGRSAMRAGLRSILECQVGMEYSRVKDKRFDEDQAGESLHDAASLSRIHPIRQQRDRSRV